MQESSDCSGQGWGRCWHLYPVRLCHVLLHQELHILPTGGALSCQNSQRNSQRSVHPQPPTISRFCQFPVWNSLSAGFFWQKSVFHAWETRNNCWCFVAVDCDWTLTDQFINNQNESEPGKKKSVEFWNLKMDISNTVFRFLLSSVSFQHCRFFHSCTHCAFNVFVASSHFEMTQCTLNYMRMSLEKGRETRASIVIQDCVMLRSFISVVALESEPHSDITFVNSSVNKTNVVAKGPVGWVINNCSVVIGHSRHFRSPCKGMMKISGAGYVRIHNSRISADRSMKNNKCVVHIVGKPSLTVVEVNHSTLVGTVGAIHGGLIKCDQVTKFEVVDSLFTATRWSHPPVSGGFFYFKEGNLLMNNVTFDVTSLVFKARVSVLLVSDSGDTRLTGVSLLCPASFSVDHHGGDLFQRDCVAQCDKDWYSLDQGFGLLKSSWKRDTSNVQKQEYKIESNASKVSCLPCPIGAHCRHQTIQSLPNYWGYVDSEHRVNMMRCPDGYCCSGNNDCRGIDSCRTNRTGKLCGKCRQGMTESLLSSKCVDQMKCQTARILGVYIACVVIYSFGVLLIGPLKKCARFLLKKVWGVVKRRCQCKKEQIKVTSSEATVDTKQGKPRREKNNDNNLKEDNKKAMRDREQQDSDDKQISDHQEKSHAEHEEDEGTSLEYLQILFYYVQDASLFRVHLATQDVSDDSVILKIFHFSPDFLTLHSKVSDLCISFGTAVSKVLFKSLFGSCVMAFLFVLYILQKICSLVCCKNSHCWKSIRAQLMQALFVTLLFSYQKLVTGAFILIQCVKVGEANVLYIQGNIQCYNWLQWLALFYIVFFLCPILIVMSHAVFWLRDKQISARQFVLYCLFPTPGVLIPVAQHARKLYSQLLEMSMKPGTKSLPQQNVELENGDKNATEEAREDAIYPKFVRPVRPVIWFMTSFLASDTSTQTERQTNTHMKTHSTSHTTADLKHKHTACEGEIFHALLRPYRHLTACGISFTWLGIHNMYRLTLVALNTRIADTISRLFGMTSLLVMLSLAVFFLRPYKDPRRNQALMMSCAANISVAMLNICRAGLATFDCKNNCSAKALLIQAMGVGEKFLLEYIPWVGVALLLLNPVWDELDRKAKNEQKSVFRRNRWG